MKPTDTTIINTWLGGVKPPGVYFAINDAALIVAGHHQGEAVSVISLVELEPEVIYIVERGDGSDLVEKQANLSKEILKE